MSTGNYTPGPWHIGMKPGPMVYGPKGEQVADLTARMVPDDETSGNARLIAAAPELAAALLALVDYCQTPRHASEGIARAPRQRDINAARAALEKAGAL